MLVAVTLVFFLMRLIGGDPFRHGPLLGLKSEGGWVKYGDYQPPAIKNNLERRYGLDLPWYQQYGNYLQGVATFDLGPSLSFRDRSVNDIIREHAPVSFELGMLALLWAVVIGIPAGVLGALRPGTLGDHVIGSASSLALALPNFLVATLLIYYLSVKLGWLPTTGWESWRHKVLPSFVLGLVPMAWLARLMRTSVLATMNLEYVQAARVRGLRARRILTAHVLRNSLIPVITAALPLLGYLVTGSFIIETIFSVPGTGRFFVAAAAARDYTVVMGLTVLLTTVMIVANLTVDLLYGLLDPRIRDTG